MLESLGLETIGAGVRTGGGDGVHDLVDVGLDVLGGVLEVILHDVLGIQTELGGSLRLLGIVDDQELVGAVLGAQLHAIRAQSILDPELGGIGMRGALEDGGGADLKGGAGGGDDQRNVVIAVVQDLGDAVMQEADADDALAGAHVLGRAGAGMPSSWPYFWIMVLMTSLAVPAVL